MGEDLIAYIMKRAARKFGGRDGKFNSANFGAAFSEIVGVGTPGGDMVAAMLWGRDDVERLHGGCHWRIREPDHDE